MSALRHPPSPPAGWKSVRPWTPRLALHVREISPVSVTFVLSSTINPLLSEEDDEVDDSDHAGPSQIRKPFPASVLSISDILGGGLAVQVNNAPWERVVMHIDDDTDEEAIVILYGLLPGRQYDIELAVVAGEDSIRGKITTDAALDDEDAEREAEGEGSALLSVQQPLTPAATRPTTPVPPPDPPRPLTVEERASQLLHSLTALDAEKEAHVVRLKSARRESQRADAALRSEIEALKRASEKSAQADQRSRQKILALQEAIKQLLAASVEADAQVKLVEGSLPQLEERARAIEVEYAKVKDEAAKSKAEADDAVKSDKRRIGELENELASLSHRLDKLTNKKEKLAGDTVPELEHQLADLGKEIEEIELEGTFLPTPPPAHQELHHHEFDHEARYPHHYFNSNVTPNFNRTVQPIGRPNNSPGSAAPGLFHSSPISPSSRKAM